MNKLFLSTNNRHSLSSRHRKQVDEDRNYNQGERTIQRCLNEAGVKYNRPLSKPLLTEVHRKNRLKWAQNNKATNCEQVIFSDEITIRLNIVKKIGMKLDRKKEDPSNRQAFEQGERLELFFQVKILVASSVSSRT